jgi:hypothetical protein
VESFMAVATVRKFLAKGEGCNRGAAAWRLGVEFDGGRGEWAICMAAASLRYWSRRAPIWRSGLQGHDGTSSVNVEDDPTATCAAKPLHAVAGPCRSKA